MSTSRPLPHKKQGTSILATPTYPSPQPSRLFAPPSTPAPGQMESIPTESALSENRSRLRWNIAQTPIFPDPATITMESPASPGLQELTRAAKPQLDLPPVPPPSTSQIVQRQNGDETPQHVTPKKNETGLPDALKAGVESLSGMSLDDVTVHYNSAKPAPLQALAYTQGSEIHVAPGQEKHLPHEAWHVVQQKQGRVKPTLQAKGVGINDDEELEEEADVMGKKVVQKQSVFTPGEYAMPRTITQRKPLNHEIKHTSPRNMLFGTQQSTSPVQMINVGWVPHNPANWRNVTTIAGHTAATRGGASFGNLRYAVAADNAVNAATGKVKVTLPAGHLLSDVGGTDIPNYIQAAKLTPEIDHIVEAQEGGANDFENARVATKAENNAPGTPRAVSPAYGGNIANVDLKIYTPITIAKKKGYGGPHVLATGDVLTFKQTKALAKYAAGTTITTWDDVDKDLIDEIINTYEGYTLHGITIA